MKRWAKIFSFTAAVAAFTAIAVSIRPPKFETSLEAVAGRDVVPLPEPIRKAAACRVQAVASSKSFEKAYVLAQRFVAGLDGRLRQSVRFRIDEGGLPEALDFYRRSGGGFVAPEDVRLCGEGGGKLLEEVVARIASPVPSLFRFKDDPYRLLDGFVKNLPRGFGLWRARNGVLAAEKDGIWHVLVSFAIPERSALDIRKLPEILKPVMEEARRLNAEDADARLALSGVPVHTMETSGRCEEQIGLLSSFSLVFIFVLAAAALRSLSSVFMIALNLALSGAAGFAALALAFDSIHLVSLVFGTALIGIAVDYSFHRILTASGDEFPGVRSNLLKSCLTTLVGLAPLAFSGIGILVQSAVFLSAGLLTSLFGNLFVFDSGERRSPEKVPGGGDAGCAKVPKLKSIPLLVLLFAVVPFLFSVDFTTKAGDLHSPSEELKAAERQISELSGIGGDAGMLVVRGESLEDVLEKESAIAADGLSLSKFIPPFSRREANARMIREFHQGSSRTIARRLGFDGEFPPPQPARRLEAADVPAAIAGQFLFTGKDGGVMTLLPRVSMAEVAKTGGEDCKFYAPRAMLLKTLDAYGRRILRLLAVSVALLAGILWLFFRARAFLVVLPPLLAVSLMFVAVSVFNAHVNLFHLLSSFMIVGMALDYTIFLADGFRGSFKAVVCSLLTSMVGFGSLAFVSFPIVRSFGVAMGIGLPLSFLVAWILFRPHRKRNERAATFIGLETTWIIYRLFGKRALDFTAWAVGNLVWAFDAESRRAAASRRRLVNFAMSLGDKVAVLSAGRGQPKIRLDESGDARRFIGDVASRKGVVVVSSHLGNIETLAAYGECAAKFHVFMALSISEVFRSFKERHACRPMVEVHPTEGFGMAELFMGGEIVERGDVVLIAGDRGGGRCREMPFLGGLRRFPEGAFRFAAHLERPIYFVASVRERGGYRVFAKLLSRQDALSDYVRELERLVKRYPEQWYQWEDDGRENG